MIDLKFIKDDKPDDVKVPQGGNLPIPPESIDSQQHIDTVDWLIKHLDGTKIYDFGGEKVIHCIKDTMIFATDAAYADNRDRKSSERYPWTLWEVWLTGRQRSRALILKQRHERNILVVKAFQKSLT